jgi:hypothetical protein
MSCQACFLLFLQGTCQALAWLCQQGPAPVYHVPGLATEILPSLSPGVPADVLPGLSPVVSAGFLSGLFFGCTYLQFSCPSPVMLAVFRFLDVSTEFLYVAYRL